MPVILDMADGTNPHVSQLQNVLSANDEKPEWLVVADHDPVMNRQIGKLIDDRSAVMLTVPQGGWQMESGILPEALRWSIAEEGLENVLIVGHSEADVVACEATWIGDSVTGSSASTNQYGYDRLLQGVRLVQDRIQQAKDHFSQQAIYLLQDEVLQELIFTVRCESICCSTSLSRVLF